MKLPESTDHAAVAVSALVEILDQLAAISVEIDELIAGATDDQLDAALAAIRPAAYRLWLLGDGHAKDRRAIRNDRLIDRYQAKRADEADADVEISNG